MNRPYPPGTSSIWQWIGDAPPGHQDKPSPKALEDLARRRALGDRTDLTGRLLGDPPPGRSALDRKRGREEAERLVELLTLGESDGHSEEESER